MSDPDSLYVDGEKPAEPNPIHEASKAFKASLSGTTPQEPAAPVRQTGYSPGARGAPVPHAESGIYATESPESPQAPVHPDPVPAQQSEPKQSTPETTKFRWKGQELDLSPEQQSMLMEYGAQYVESQQESQTDIGVEPPSEQPTDTPEGWAQVGTGEDGKPIWSNDPTVVALAKQNQALTEKMNGWENQAKLQQNYRSMQSEYQEAIKDSKDYQEVSKLPGADKMVNTLAMLALYGNASAPMAVHASNAVKQVKELAAGVRQGMFESKAAVAAQAPAEGGGVGIPQAPAKEYTAADMQSGIVREDVARYLAKRHSGSL
jgi:hypothetical protein